MKRRSFLQSVIATVSGLTGLSVSRTVAGNHKGTLWPPYLNYYDLKKPIHQYNWHDFITKTNHVWTCQDNWIIGNSLYLCDPKDADTFQMTQLETIDVCTTIIVHNGLVYWLGKREVWEIYHVEQGAPYEFSFRVQKLGFTPYELFGDLIPIGVDGDEFHGEFDSDQCDLFGEKTIRLWREAEERHSLAVRENNNRLEKLKEMC